MKTRTESLLTYLLVTLFSSVGLNKSYSRWASGPKCKMVINHFQVLWW